MLLMMIYNTFLIRTTVDLEDFIKNGNALLGMDMDISK